MRFNVSLSLLLVSLAHSRPTPLIFRVTTPGSALLGGQWDGEYSIVPLLGCQRSSDTAEHPYAAGIECGQLHGYCAEWTGETCIRSSLCPTFPIFPD